MIGADTVAVNIHFITCKILSALARRDPTLQLSQSMGSNAILATIPFSEVKKVGRREEVLKEDVVDR